MVKIIGNALGQAYVDNGSAMKYNDGSGGACTFSEITGSPYDNTNLKNALDSKQVTLESGTSIKTINNESLLGSGNITIESSTIAESIKDQNNTTNGIKTWTGTLAQYNAITTKDDNTLYNITDDNDVSLSVLQMIYPVGSLYLTTNTTCPLASLFGTWVQEQNIVNNKFIIETYVDGTNGYRIWNDGYCEQWGYNSSSASQINLLKEFKDTNYSVYVTNKITTNSYDIGVKDRQTTYFNGYFVERTGCWKASGYLAEGEYTPITIPTYNKFRRIA